MASRRVSRKTSLVAVPLGTLPEIGEAVVWLVDRLPAEKVPELPEAEICARAASAQKATTIKGSQPRSIASLEYKRHRGQVWVLALVTHLNARKFDFEMAVTGQHLSLQLYG